MTTSHAPSASGQTGRRILASVGEGKAVISVSLRPDQEHVASELASRYGSAVKLRVGFFAFPERRCRRPRPAAGLALEEQALGRLEMSVEVDQKVLEADDDGHGRLVLLNSSPERIGPLHCGQPLRSICLHGYSHTDRRLCSASGDGASCRS